MSGHAIADLEFDGKTLRQWAKKFPKRFEKFIRKLGLEAEKRAVLFVNKGGKYQAEVTGNLTDGINHRVDGSGTDASVVVYSVARNRDGVNYAPFVHEGTGVYGPLKRPYTIRPVHAKALAIPMAGVVTMTKQGSFGGVIVKSVTIRGMKPRPYLKEAVKETLSPKVMKKLFERAFKTRG
ncbi:MAG: hypothetical protein P9M15_00900 [Candidatus Electryoneaceae bacterium]|nr:hypothetical protein [Candidatus Electryoneaceae bacterium]